MHALCTCFCEAQGRWVNTYLCAFVMVVITAESLPRSSGLPPMILSSSVPAVYLTAQSYTCSIWKIHLGLLMPLHLRAWELTTPSLSPTISGAEVQNHSMFSSRWEKIMQCNLHSSVFMGSDWGWDITKITPLLCFFLFPVLTALTTWLVSPVHISFSQDLFQENLT